MPYQYLIQFSFLLLYINRYKKATRRKGIGGSILRDVAVKIGCRKEECEGDIIFGGSKIIFFDKNNRKSIVKVSLDCDKCSLKSRRVTILHNIHHCVCCEEDVSCLIDQAKIKVINFLPGSNEIVFRITVICLEGTTNEIVHYQEFD